MGSLFWTSTRGDRIRIRTVVDNGGRMSRKFRFLMDVIYGQLLLARRKYEILINENVSDRKMSEKCSELFVPERAPAEKVLHSH